MKIHSILCIYGRLGEDPFPKASLHYIQGFDSVRVRMIYACRCARNDNPLCNLKPILLPLFVHQSLYIIAHDDLIRPFTGESFARYLLGRIYTYLGAIGQ